MATLLKVIRIAFVAGPTPARWFVVLWFTVSIWTTFGCNARIKTSGSLCFTDSIAWALVIRLASSRSLASDPKWITRGSWRTLAMESTNDVDTDGSHSTRAVRVDRKVRCTFVHIPTASLRVTGATRVTLALRS